MPGPPRKRHGRQRHDSGAPITTIPLHAPPVEVPDPPAGLLAATQREWRAYWQSPLALTVIPATDAPALARLFQLRDDATRMARVVRKQPFVSGYKGQPRVNPLATLVATMNAESRNLEDRFGLTPMSRLRLGITFGDAARSLADLNAELAGRDDAYDDEEAALLATLQRGPE